MHLHRIRVSHFILTIMSITLPQTEDWSNDNYPSFQIQVKANEDQIMCYLKSCPVCWRENCTSYTQKHIGCCHDDDNEKAEYYDENDLTFENEIPWQDWGLSTCALCSKSICECTLDPNYRYIDTTCGSDFVCSDDIVKKQDF